MAAGVAPTAVAAGTEACEQAGLVGSMAWVPMAAPMEAVMAGTAVGTQAQRMCPAKCQLGNCSAHSEAHAGSGAAEAAEAPLQREQWHAMATRD